MKNIDSKLSLALQIVPSGCGKSTFARKQFMSTGVV
jgi:ABC-type phosphate transport system ATPase subunit